MGNWGMVEGPQEFYWGGTFWFGSKVAAADESKVEGVKQIIEFFCVNDETMLGYMRDTGDFPSKKTVAASLVADGGSNNLFLFGTDHYAVFSKIAERIDITKNITVYDEIMNSLFDDFINAVFADGETVEDALAAMREGVRERATSVTVR